MNESPSPGAAAESARVPTVPATPSARARKSAPTPRAPAPAHATIPAAVVDGLVVMVLGACLFFRRLDSSAERIVAILVIAAVAGVHVVDLLRAQLRGGPPGGGTGTGLTLAVVSALASVGHHLAHFARLRSGALVPLGLLAVLSAAGCASGPRSTDDTVKGIFAGATAVRDFACGDAASLYLGRPLPPSIDAPAQTPVEIAQRIRDWLCADPLGDLIELGQDLARDLTRTRAPPVNHAPAPVNHAPAPVNHATAPVNHAPELVHQTQDGGTP